MPHANDNYQLPTFCQRMYLSLLIHRSWVREYL